VEIASLIDEAKRVYAEAGLDCGDGLLPPASEADIDAVGVELGLPLPSELRELWRAHGGQEEVGAGVSGLFGWHRLITPAAAVEHNRLYGETCIIDRTTYPPAPGAWGSWVPELIPFATFNDDDLCVHSASGEVWAFRPGSGLGLRRPSIATALRELISAARAGREPVLE
jgi:cell wall assembly regulator SMI1